MEPICSYILCEVPRQCHPRNLYIKNFLPCAVTKEPLIFCVTCIVIGRPRLCSRATQTCNPVVVPNILAEIFMVPLGLSS
jgi:hypothetical protein